MPWAAVGPVTKEAVKPLPAVLPSLINTFPVTKLPPFAEAITEA